MGEGEGEGERGERKGGCLVAKWINTTAKMKQEVVNFGFFLIRS